MIFQSTLPRRERRSDPRHPAAQQRDFNPRSRVGSDHPVKPLFSMFHVFQSTLPRRERRKPVTIRIKFHYFNPRSRVGSDNNARQKDSALQYFNPRSRVGSDTVILPKICASSM